ncbi:MAG: MOSC domain-containing protein, partial [Mesorhizobium sp.]
MNAQAALGTVSQLWRYPASSLAGERLDAIS